MESTRISPFALRATTKAVTIPFMKDFAEDIGFRTYTVRHVQGLTPNDHQASRTFRE